MLFVILRNANLKQLKHKNRLIIHTMEIKILGTGCKKCNELEEATKKTVTVLGINATIGKEEDMMNIMSYGVNRTPALVVDGKVVVSGRVPNEKELKALLTK